MSLFIIILIPLLVSAITFLVFKLTITWKEFLLQLGVSVLIGVSGYFTVTCSALQDTQHLNGRITNKINGTQGCCHCHDICTGRDSKGNCTSTVRICAHSIDYWWSLNTSVGRIPIDNCSGSDRDPEVWANARIGEPASVSSTYENYLKADPDSLIVHENINEQYFTRVPDYPKIYDYYKVDPVLSDGVYIPAGWQNYIREFNAEFGASHQVDLVVLLTNVSDPEYAQAVESKWLYGPKNSITVVIGVKNYIADWVRVVTISEVEELKVLLRDNIQGKSINNLEIPKIIGGLVATKFKRTPLEKFAYLEKSLRPSTTATIILIIITLAVSIGIGVYCHKEDVFGDESTYPRWKRRGYYGN